MPVEMRLSRIIISEINESQTLFLQEVGGPRRLPILVGLFEATRIDKRVKDIRSPRPLTHELIVNAIAALGGELESILVNEIKNETYFALLRIKTDGGIKELDCRPSDAIAVALSCEPPRPIFVSEEVLEQAGAVQ